MLQNHDNRPTTSTQEPQQQKQQKKQAAAATTATTATVYTHPGVSYVRQIIAEEYQGVLHTQITMPVIMLMERCMSAGMEPEVILAAIEATGWARRPSPQYLRAILQRCLREGILTAEAWEHHEQERCSDQASANAEIYRLWYGQDNLPFLRWILREGILQICKVL